MSKRNRKEPKVVRVSSLDTESRPVWKLRYEYEVEGSKELKNVDNTKIRLEGRFQIQEYGARPLWDPVTMLQYSVLCWIEHTPVDKKKKPFAIKVTSATVAEFASLQMLDETLDETEKHKLFREWRLKKFEDTWEELDTALNTGDIDPLEGDWKPDGIKAILVFNLIARADELTRAILQHGLLDNEEDTTAMLARVVDAIRHMDGDDMLVTGLVYNAEEEEFGILR